MNNFIKQYKEKYKLIDSCMVYFYGLVLNRQSIQNIKNEIVSYLVTKTSTEFILSGEVGLEVSGYNLKYQQIEKIIEPSIITCQISIRTTEKKKTIYVCKTVFIEENLALEKSQEKNIIEEFKNEYQNLQKKFVTLKQEIEKNYLIEEKINNIILDESFFSFLVYNSQEQFYGNWQNNILFDVNLSNFKQVNSKEIVYLPENIYQFFFFIPQKKIIFSTHLISNEYKVEFLDKQTDLLVF